MQMAGARCPRCGCLAPRQGDTEMATSDYPIEIRVGEFGDEHRFMDGRQLVDCDDDCLAFDEPQGEFEVKQAYKHWRSHGYLGGCSHAR